MLEIKKDINWKVYRGEILLDEDEHRDLVFLSSCNLAEESEEIRVYKENGEVDFKIIMD